MVVIWRHTFSNNNTKIKFLLVAGHARAVTEMLPLYSNKFKKDETSDLKVSVSAGSTLLYIKSH